ncbi:MAG TPA: hypothetical protein VMZ52_16815 [Bryobacteraceae bacterium]|nr:hypothetical protein [Bryobacteraceae bacterium]
MEDWKAVATARGLAIPEEDLTRLLPVMDALAASFRPLLEALPEDSDTAVNFTAEAPEPR